MRNVVVVMLYKQRSRLRRLAVLLTEELGGVDQVGEGGLGLLPLTGLETTVRVDPKLLRLEILEGKPRQ
jgi:hypothetical protein